jgi:hypothetical protein
VIFVDVASSIDVLVLLGVMGVIAVVATVGVAAYLYRTFRR